MRKTDAATLDHCVQLYLSGLNAAQVSRETGVPHSVILRELQHRDIPTRPRTVVDEEAVCRAYVGGMSENAVAKQFGFTRLVVTRILREHGIERRGQSEAERLKWANMPAEERARRAERVRRVHTGRKPSFETVCKMTATRERNQSCQTSPHEAGLAAMLSAKGIDFISQKAIGPYNCDIAAFPVAVEVFGGHWHWHGAHKLRSEERFRYILNAGWNILAVAATESFPITAEVADYVAAYIEETRRNPPAICEYRVIWGACEFSVGGRADDDHFTIEPPFTGTRDPASGRYKRVAREAAKVSGRSGEIDLRPR